MNQYWEWVTFWSILNHFPLFLNSPILIKRTVFTGKHCSKICTSVIPAFLSLTVLLPVWTSSKSYEKFHSPFLFQHWLCWCVDQFLWLCEQAVLILTSYTAAVKMTMKYFPNVSHILPVCFFLSTFASLSFMLSFLTIACLFVLPALKDLSYTRLVEIV